MRQEEEQGAHTHADICLHLTISLAGSKSKPPSFKKSRRSSKSQEQHYVHIENYQNQN